MAPYLALLAETEPTSPPPAFTVHDFLSLPLCRLGPDERSDAFNQVAAAILKRFQQREAKNKTHSHQPSEHEIECMARYAKDMFSSRDCYRYVKNFSTRVQTSFENCVAGWEKEIQSRDLNRTECLLLVLRIVAGFDQRLFLRSDHTDNNGYHAYAAQIRELQLWKDKELFIDFLEHSGSVFDNATNLVWMARHPTKRLLPCWLPLTQEDMIHLMRQDVYPVGIVFEETKADTFSLSPSLFAWHDIRHTRNAFAIHNVVGLSTSEDDPLDQVFSAQDWDEIQPLLQQLESQYRWLWHVLWDALVAGKKEKKQDKKSGEAIVETLFQTVHESVYSPWRKTQMLLYDSNQTFRQWALPIIQQCVSDEKKWTFRNYTLQVCWKGKWLNFLGIIPTVFSGAQNDRTSLRLPGLPPGYTEKGSIPIDEEVVISVTDFHKTMASVSGTLDLYFSTTSSSVPIRQRYHVRSVTHPQLSPRMPDLNCLSHWTFQFVTLCFIQPSPTEPLTTWSFSTIGRNDLASYVKSTTIRHWPIHHECSIGSHPHLVLDDVLKRAIEVVMEFDPTVSRTCHEVVSSNLMYVMWKHGAATKLSYSKLASRSCYDSKTQDLVVGPDKKVQAMRVGQSALPVSMRNVSGTESVCFPEDREAIDCPQRICFDTWLSTYFE
jgi:hypothetical protein